MARTSRPVLGALGEALQNAAYQVPAMQMQNATLQQRYAEFQEEKRKTAQGQSNWEFGQRATADYRKNMFKVDWARQKENERHNKVMELPDPVVNKPPTKSEVEAQILGRMSPEQQIQYMLNSGKGFKPDPSIVRTLMDLWKGQRRVPKQQGFNASGMPIEIEAYDPPIVGAASDTANYITRLGEWPSEPLGGQGRPRGQGGWLPEVLQGIPAQQNQQGQAPLTPEEEAELQYLLNKTQGRR